MEVLHGTSVTGEEYIRPTSATGRIIPKANQISNIFIKISPKQQIIKTDREFTDK